MRSLSVFAIALAFVALATIQPVPAYHADDPSVENGGVSFTVEHERRLKRVEYPLGTGNTFLGGQTGGIDVTLRYDDALVNVGGNFFAPESNRRVERDAFAILDGLTIAERGIVEDGRVAYVSQAKLDPAGRPVVVVTHWVRNVDDAPIAAMRVYPMLVTSSINSAGEGVVARDAATGTVVATNAWGARAALGIHACSPPAAVGISHPFNVGSAIEADSLEAVPPPATESAPAIGFALDVGPLSAGETRQVDVVLRAGDGASDVTDARAFCPAASAPPLPFILALPDFAVTALEVERATREAAGLAVDDPAAPWTVRMTVANEGGVARCRLAYFSATSHFGTEFRDGGSETVCLGLGESRTLEFPWTPVRTYALDLYGVPGYGANAMLGDVSLRGVIETSATEPDTEDNVLRARTHVVASPDAVFEAAFGTLP